MYLTGKILVLFGTGVFVILATQTSKECNKFKIGQSSLCDPSQRIFRRSCNMLLPQPADLEDCTFVFEKNTTGCNDKQFPQAQDKHNLHNFKLNIYRYDNYYVLSVLNTSITNVQWKDLEMKFKPENDDAAVCINFHIRKDMQLPTAWHLFYDCPLYGEWIENMTFTLEYVATVDGHHQSRKLTFITPIAEKLDPCLKTVDSRQTLVYLDISFFPHIVLHIQSLPAFFEVSEYEVKKCTNLHDCVSYKTIEEQDKLAHISVPINIATEYNSFFFAVFAKSRKCKKGSCFISRTTLLTMPDRNYWIIIMWFLPGLFMVLALVIIIYLHWRKFILKLFEVDSNFLHPKMLILHEPLHKEHMNMVQLLSQFLEQYCYIDILLDQRDIHQEDPRKWYSKAMSSAKFIAIISSPSCKTESQAIYQDLYRVGLRSVEEAICNTKERIEIFTILLPYCNKTSIPHIASHLKCIHLWKDFNKMIYFIHKNTHSQSMISQCVLLNEIKNNFEVYGRNVVDNIINSETIFEQNGESESVRDMKLEIPVNIISIPSEEQKLLQNKLDGSNISEECCFEKYLFPDLSGLDLLGESEHGSMYSNYEK